MFNPSSGCFSDFQDSYHTSDDFRLRNVVLTISDASTAVFTAKIVAPSNAKAWARCWVSNAVEGALAEAEVGGLVNGDEARLQVKLDSESVPELACIRIESAPLATEHTLHVRLCKGEIYFVDRLRLELNSIEATREMVDTMPAEVKAELSDAWLKMVLDATESEAWIHGFAIYDRSTNEQVGNGGFKGPAQDGEVEIAYGIDESHRGQGFATSVAMALTNYAFGQSNEIGKVIAHTLPESNASTNVLANCDFQNVGEVIDPDDGRVWRWEKPRESC